MGLDFLRKSARKYRKSLDRHRVELGTPTLFTQQPISAPRIYAAKLCDGQTVSPEETLGVRLDKDQVVVTRGLDPIATIDSTPSELIVALLDSEGEAIGLVKAVHDDAGVAEVAVC